MERRQMTPEQVAEKAFPSWRAIESRPTRRGAFVVMVPREQPDSSIGKKVVLVSGDEVTGVQG